MPITIDTRTDPAPDPDAGYLFTGGTVLTMQPGAAPERVDVWVSGGRIAAVGPDLVARPDLLEVPRIDLSNSILLPGFVDTHRHAWETQFRRSIPDVDDLQGYVQSTLVEIAPQYTPEDMYIGTRLAAMTALDSGITTMLDFSHNSRSAAHSDEAIRAQADAGIRVVHASMSPHFGEWDRQWPGDLERLVDTHSSDLVSFRVAALPTDEISGPPLVYGPELAAVARNLGIGVSIDAIFGASSSRALRVWADAGLLGPEVELIHCTNLSPEAWGVIADTGATVSLAPTSDAQIGTETAVPAIDEALAAGVRPGLSIDVEVALSSDMFTQMRALLAMQRMRAVERGHAGGAPEPRITTADVLDFATAQGARTIGLQETTGRIAPGMAADLIVVAADDVNSMPMNDAVGTVVLGADPRNIRAVFVAGRPRKWNGRLLGLDVPELHDAVIRSREAIRGRVSATRAGSGR